MKRFNSLFSIGFRPFFLVASLFSCLLILVWIGFYYFSIDLPVFNYYPATIWHAHEMIFGYSIAIIAGFLLTAIANWTGIKTINGAPLAFIVIIWALGRLLPFLSFLPDYLIASIDFLFLPLLTYNVAKPLIKTNNKRNYFIIGLMLIFCFLNGLIHLNLLDIIKINLNSLLLFALYLIITLIIIMAGRVFPMFSQNGVDNRYEVKKFKLIEKLTIPSFILFSIVNLFSENSWLILVTSLLTSLIHLIRLIGWYNHQIWKKPLVWVLHAGYLLFTLSLFLSSFKGFYPILNTLSLHGFTIGVIGTLTLGMISRVSLGHTGRNLHKPPKSLKLAFTAIILSALTRVISPLIFKDFYLLSVFISSLFWLIAFVIFFIQYLHILSSPRVEQS